MNLLLIFVLTRRVIKKISNEKIHSREAELLKKINLKNPFIIQYYDDFKESFWNHFIVIEYCEVH